MRWNFSKLNFHYKLILSICLSTIFYFIKISIRKLIFEQVYICMYVCMYVCVKNNCPKDVAYINNGMLNTKYILRTFAVTY
jgi:hypothetical protein